ncbi:hypothetical protein [Hoeflea prorocentri]|uniref:Uncharacterized protein n=1 Tax=Hoeflea prorocentri TaxID=1922333 RepID=A0A9X3UE10_9HYPH|nr:hypothetical protein [Hoeflea prorocentri]MCY6379577.1 hypothetical protein [Hoeflea prorocentri]MDA5397377.1 hypothetical protein [Hoeflea prorocentri]
MELDGNYLDASKQAQDARKRVKLTVLAIAACAILFTNLVAEGKPVDDGPQIENCIHEVETCTLRASADLFEAGA